MTIIDKGDKTMHISIEHVAIYATDLEKTKDFYIKYFDGVSSTKYENKNGFSSYFITFASGARLEVMAHKNLSIRKIEDKVNGLSHIAFSVGSKENVLALTHKLTTDGYTLLSAPRETGDGYFESCIADPDGNRVEITI